MRGKDEAEGFQSCGHALRGVNEGAEAAGWGRDAQPTRMGTGAR